MLSQWGNIAPKQLKMTFGEEVKCLTPIMYKAKIYIYLFIYCTKILDIRKKLSKNATYGAEI